MRFTDRRGVTVELNPTLGTVRVFDEMGNDYATSPTGLMHHLYRSCEDKTYVPRAGSPALPHIDTKVPECECAGCYPKSEQIGWDANGSPVT